MLFFWIYVIFYIKTLKHRFTRQSSSHAPSRPQPLRALLVSLEPGRLPRQIWGHPPCPRQLRLPQGAAWGEPGDPGAWRAVGPRSQGEGAGSAGEDTSMLCHRRGGSNAAWTAADSVEGDFSLLPSGMITQWNNSGSQWGLNITAFIGKEVVIHLDGLFKEAEKNIQTGEGLEGWTKNSHTWQSSYCAWFSSDSWWYPGTTERRTSRKKFGYHKKGICPIYPSQKDQSGLRICDLVSDFEGFSERFQVLANHYKSIYPT